MTPDLVRYAPSVEQEKSGEAETIEELNGVFGDILNTTAKDYGHAVRSVHAKAHGVLEGVLTVDADLPPELAQGLFARAGEHKAYVRLSTNAGDILPDEIGLPRGLALKVLGVEGERLEGAEGTTQDFVMVNGQVFQNKTADQFATNLKMLAKSTDRMEGAKKALSAVLGGVSSALGAVGVESVKLASLGGAPNVDPLGETYYSVTPFRYGDYIAKFSLTPIAPDLTRRTGHKVDAHDNPNAIRDMVRHEMQGVEGVWQFRVQLCRDLHKQPVEDPTHEWKSSEAPWQRVAILRVEPQDSWDDARLQAVNEEMRFSVWTGLKAHQPLGNINRARRDTYKRSSDFRAGFNKCPIHEPARCRRRRSRPAGG